MTVIRGKGAPGAPAIRRLRAAALIVLGLSAPSHAMVPDVLDAPAVQSARSAGAAMLALAEAGTRLLAAGERGIIRYSDDGGRRWIQARTPVSVSLTALDFATPQVGWAVGHGGVVLRTNDGGQQWTRQLDGRRIARLARDQAGADAQAAAAAKRLEEEGPDKPLLALLALSPQRAIVAGAYGLALETRDGGANWTLMTQRIGDPRGRHLYAIAALPGQGLMLAGEQGALFRSNDDGASFAAVDSPYEGTFFRLASNQAGGLLLVGMRGHAFVGDAGGGNWRRSSIPAAASLGALALGKDGMIFVADEAGQLYRSADGGRSFVASSGPRSAAVTDMRIRPDGAAVLAGMRGVSILPLAQARVGEP